MILVNPKPIDLNNIHKYVLINLLDNLLDICEVEKFDYNNLIGKPGTFYYALTSAYIQRNLNENKSFRKMFHISSLKE